MDNRQVMAIMAAILKAAYLANGTTGGAVAERAAALLADCGLFLQPPPIDPNFDAGVGLGSSQDKHERAAGVVLRRSSSISRAAVLADADVIGWATRAAVLGNVLAERERQITQEHYSLAHDDKHDEGELAHAAIHYLGLTVDGIDAPWPWDDDTAPGPDASPGRRLEIAMALLLAEAERIDRLAMKRLGVQA